MKKSFIIFCFLTAILTSWASANVSVEGDLTRLFDAQPGTVITDELVLRNSGDADAQVRVYLTDYSYSADGTSAYPEPGTLERSNADWMKLNPVPNVVPAGESVQLSYRIEVPGTAGTGSFWSMIMVEEVQPENDAAGTLALTTVLRYGIQIVTTLGSAPSELAFANPAFSNVNGTSVLTVDIENTGQVSLRTSYHLDLFDSAGTPLGRFEGSTLRSHPGTSVRQQFQLDNLPPGPYVAIIIADAGGENVFGAQYNLTVNE